MAVFNKPMWRIDRDSEGTLWGNLMNIVTVYPTEDSDDNKYSVCIVVPTPLFKWLKDARNVDSDSEIELYLECQADGKFTFGVQWKVADDEYLFDDLWTYRRLPDWAAPQH